ncbi:ATP-binding protein, partial [Cellulomonas triticagri]
AAAPGGPVDLGLATAVWRAWSGHAAAVAAGDAAPLPDLDVVPALVAPDRVALVHAEDAAVAPGPMWWQRTDVAAMVPAVGVDADDLADVLGLPTAADLADGSTADDDGDLLPTAPEVATVLPGAPRTWVEHEALRVDGVPVDWWVDGAGPDAVVHATHLAGLARGLAQAAGAWPRRHAVALVLVEPARAGELAVEQVGDEVPTAPGA